MKFGLYPRLALAGIRKNKRLYIPYLLTCTGMAMMYYIIIFLQHNEMLDGMRGGTTASTILALGGWVVAIFACIFLFYTHSFLLRRRKKEFGLYNVLGMNKGHIARVIGLETLIAALVILAGGIGAGMLLDRLIYLLVANLIGFEVSLGFYISTGSIVQTLQAKASCSRRSVRRWSRGSSSMPPPAPNKPFTAPAAAPVSPARSHVPRFCIRDPSG